MADHKSTTLGHDGTHHLSNEPVDVAANIPALEHLFLCASPALGTLPRLEYVTEQGIPIGYRTGRCAAGLVPERRRPAGRGRAGCSPGRGLAKAQSGAAAVSPGQETSRSFVTDEGSAAPTRGEGERAAFVLVRRTVT